MSTQEPVDLFIIGGGINGCGIARDAVGRGYSVALAEMNDLGSATSSASTKLFHGGLRYLEFFEFRLVREALKEREVLLQAMPHISWPMRFVLPVHRDMRFDSDTPTSRLLSLFMPWMKGRRPDWLIRLGLFLYDHMGGRRILPPTRNLTLTGTPEGAPLQEKYRKAFEYSDCWVEDSRLVVLNARDAAARGAAIRVGTRVTGAEYRDGAWDVQCKGPEGETTTRARMIVNAGGPWVGDILRQTLRQNTSQGVRLVRGSHIVTRRLFDHDKCYFFQGTDGRIIFAIPYEEDFTLIGTTDADHDTPDTAPVCTPEEQAYLIKFANSYFAKALTPEDVIWTYSGVRPLYDDGASSATAATRDYVLSVERSGGGPLLNVFGGKITTYRRLAESALEKIDAEMQRDTKPWTRAVALPGGDFPVDGVEDLRANLARALPFLDARTIRRLVRQYGTEARAIFEGVTGPGDLGQDFGHGIYQRELDWCIANEWVRTGEDFLWRRTRQGLRLSPAEQDTIADYVARSGKS